MTSDAVGGGRLERLQMVLDQPVPCEPVRRGDREVITFE
jgi:hypothetical protein